MLQTLWSCLEVGFPLDCPVIGYKLCKWPWMRWRRGSSVVERFERTGTDMFSGPGSQVNRKRLKNMQTLYCREAKLILNTAKKVTLRLKHHSQPTRCFIEKYVNQAEQYQGKSRLPCTQITSKQKKLLEVYEVDPDWILNCAVPMNDSFPTSGSPELWFIYSHCCLSALMSFIYIISISLT